jgi:hypothetical protein
MHATARRPAAVPSSPLVPRVATLGFDDFRRPNLSRSNSLKRCHACQRTVCRAGCSGAYVPLSFDSAERPERYDQTERRVHCLGAISREQKFLVTRCF